MLVQPPARLVGNNNWLSLCPPPTIEELVASSRLSGMRFDAGTDWRQTDWSRWPITASPLSSAEDVWPTTDSQIAVASEEPNPLIASALERVGKVLVTYSVSDAVIRWVVRSGELHELVRNFWSSKSSVIGQLHPESSPAAETMTNVSEPTASSLRMIGPHDPLAALPPERPGQHSHHHTR